MALEGIRGSGTRDVRSPESAALLVLEWLFAAVLAILFFFGRPFGRPQPASSLEVTSASPVRGVVAGATVRLFDASGNCIEEKRSDSAGRALFENVPARPSSGARSRLRGIGRAGAEASRAVELAPVQAGAALISCDVAVSDASTLLPVSGAKLSYFLQGRKGG